MLGLRHSPFSHREWFIGVDCKPRESTSSLLRWRRTIARGYRTRDRIDERGNRVIFVKEYKECKNLFRARMWIGLGLTAVSRNLDLALAYDSVCICTAYAEWTSQPQSATQSVSQSISQSVGNRGSWASEHDFSQSASLTCRLTIYRRDKSSANPPVCISPESC